MFTIAIISQLTQIVRSAVELLGRCTILLIAELSHAKHFRGSALNSHLALTSLRARALLLGLTLSLGVLFLLVPVHAQTISVSNLQYSSTSVLGRQMTVTFTVSYEGASVGNYLVAAVWDVQANSYAPGSTINSNPDSCPQTTGSYSWAAACVYAISDLQGSETVSFALVILSPGTYRFLALAGLEDKNSKVIAHTPNEQTTGNPNLFSVSVIDKFTLAVSLPDQVSVTIDGVQEGPGSIGLQMFTGTHYISVPDIVQLNPTSRLKFKGWSDGSNQTSRTFDLESDAEIVATYVTQYSVSATTDSTLQSGWYNQGTVLQFTVNNTQLANNYRLLLGGFEGWYNNGELIATSPSASLTIVGPLTLSDRWNYLPYIPALLVGVIVTVTMFFARRRTIPGRRLPLLKTSSRKRSKKRTRKTRLRRRLKSRK